MMTTYLENNGALKHDEHKRRKEGIVPVFVQAPQGDAKDLKDKERSDGVLGKQLREFRDGDMAFIRPIGRREGFERRHRSGILVLGWVGEDTSRSLEGGESGRGVAWVWDKGECLGQGYR